MNIQSIYRTAFLSAALSTLSLIGTTQVVASDLISAPVSIKVSYADLNLSNPAGADALYGRIKRAAKRRAATRVPHWRTEAVARLRERGRRRCRRPGEQPAAHRVHSGKSPTVTAMLAK